MAEEPVVPAFNKGFDRLIVQLKENSKAEQDEQRRSRIAELKAQNDAVIEAKNAAAATLEELKKLDKNDKKNVKKLAEQLQTQKETIQKLEEARNDRKEEYKQGQETKNAILQMNNQTKEDAQTNKDTKSGIQEMKDALEKQKAEIEAQGGVATDSRKYNEAQLDIAQKELNLRKQSAKRDGISKAGQEEIDKEQKRINKERGSTFKNMLGALGGIGKNLKGVLGPGGVAALSGAAFLAIGAFLQSDTFQKITDYIFDTLIPKLQEFYNAFFGEEGSFMGGIKKIFSDDSGIGLIVKGLITAAALFVAFKFVALTMGITKLLSGITGIGGKKGLGRFLGKGGMLKGAVTAFAGLGASLKGFMGSITGFASKGLDMVKNAGAKLMDSAKNLAKGALDLGKKGLDKLKVGADKLHKTPEKILKGGKDLAKAMGSDVAKGGSKVASSLKGTASKTMASAAKAFKAFPRLGLAAKLVPGLGAALAAGQGIAILMDDSMSKDDKIKAFGGLLGGTLGSAGFAALGAALGTAVFPGVGTIGGGLLGGVLGYFGGEAAGRKAASFLLGEQTEEEKLGKSFSDDAATPAPITVDDFGGKGAAIADDGTDPGIDAFGGAGNKAYDSKFMRQNADGTTTTLANFETHKDRQIRKRKERSAKKQLRVEERLAMEDFGESGQISPLNQSGGGQPIVVNAPSTTNAPVNNNSTTSSNNVIVEADPMFNRVSRYAI